MQIAARRLGFAQPPSMDTYRRAPWSGAEARLGVGGADVTTDQDDRRLAADLAADIVGYSRLVEADEAGTIARQEIYR